MDFNLIDLPKTPYILMVHMKTKTKSEVLLL